MIRIEHASNPLNYGTNMMVANFMHYLNNVTEKNNKFALDVYNDEDLKIYKSQYPQLDIKRETIDYNFYYYENIIQKITNKIKREYLFFYFNKKNLYMLEKSTDKLIVLGGDDLSEYYGIEQLKRELNRLCYIKNKINIFLVGQTVGPFKEERKELVRNSLNKIEIFSRDPWTKDYLEKEIGLKNIMNSSDLALLPLPGQDNKGKEKQTLCKYKLEKDNYITIVPSGLYECYCKNRKIYIENMVDIIEYLKQNTNYKIVLLPHVLRPASVDDRNIIKSLQEIYGENERIIYIYDVMSPLEARYILGNGKLTITGRMHGAINTLQMRRPAISISYSVKYEGVIARDLDLKELVIQGNKTQSWLNKSVANETIEKIDFILNNYDKLIQRIDKSVKRSEGNIKNMICKIANKMV